MAYQDALQALVKARHRDPASDAFKSIARHHMGSVGKRELQWLADDVAKALPAAVAKVSVLRAHSAYGGVRDARGVTHYGPGVDIWED